VPDFTKVERRCHRILNALLRALEANECPVSETGNGALQVKLGGKRIAFRLREKLKQMKRPLTENERRLGIGVEKGYRTQTVGSGYLIFEIQSSLPGRLRRVWLETDECRMEDLIGEIFATMQTAVPLLRAERLAEEERENQRREREARQREIERRRKIDENRVRRFGQIATQWQQAEQMRAFLAELKSRPTDPAADIDGRSVSEWLKWLEAEIEARDPLNAGPRLVVEDIASIGEWWQEN